MSSTASVNGEGKLPHTDIAESGREMTETKHQLHRVDAGGKNNGVKRQHGMNKPARDPGDEAEFPSPRKRLGPGEDDSGSSGPVIDFDGLSRPSTGTPARLEESAEQGAERLSKMRGAVRTILQCVGENPDRPGLLDTPERYAKALMFLTKGYGQNVWDIANNAIFHENHNEMVVVKDIDIASMCEHHMLPFMGKMHIGYVPHHSVIGISKLPRIAEVFSRRLQIQERLTKEVANAIMEVLKPRGVAVVMESSHLCMVMRGVEKSTTATITSCVLGCFETEEKTRNEFLSLVGLNR
ncbi:hypothetical protein C8A01DRAFT_16890 [Parachaetomium inaequale]|uniref:GTP cyclohydrolase 1 n=1 Tax=Parachaetomium inaequale TaxID=2588326 RepID=A0AAN6PFD9_9PEZI|nr:hypothetical protein C8A01DRAFT_16890 [Parachaetomium inaequale]